MLHWWFCNLQILFCHNKNQDQKSVCPPNAINGYWTDGLQYWIWRPVAFAMCHFGAKLSQNWQCGVPYLQARFMGLWSAARVKWPNMYLERGSLVWFEINEQGDVCPGQAWLQYAGCWQHCPASDATWTCALETMWFHWQCSWEVSSPIG